MKRETLSQARKNKGLTQQQVADYLKISLRYYCNIEAGTRNGNFKLWDALEELFLIHQKELRQLSQEDNQQKH